MRIAGTLALVLAAFVLGWLAGNSTPSEQGVTPPDLPRAEGPAEESRATLVGRAAGARPPSDAAARLGAPSAPPSGEAIPAPASLLTGVAGWFEVTLEVPKDWDVHGGHVYALPAGSPGADRGEAPCVAARTGGVLRLPVLKAGAWDVGFRCPTGYAMALDVEMEEGATVPLTLRAADCQTITFRLGRPLDRSVNAGARASAKASSSIPFFPGRGDPRYVEAQVAFDGDTAVTVPLPVGIEYRVQAYVPMDHALKLDADVHPGFDLVPDREVVHAGDVVEVAVIERARLLLRLRLDGGFPSRWTRRNLTIHPAVGFALDVQGQRTASVYASIDPEVLASTSPRVAILSRPGRGRLAWTSGHDMIRSGAIEGIDLRPGRTTVLEVSLEADATVDPFDVVVEHHETVYVPIRATGLGPLSDDNFLRVSAQVRYPGDEEEQLQHLQIDGPDEDLVGEEFWAEARWVVAVQGVSRASHPVRGPFRGGIDVRLEPAGLLQVVPESLWPETLGRLRIRRADGAPLAWGHREERTTALEECALVVTAGPGTLLGPLPEGEHRFVVHVGAVRLPDAVGVVKAGRVEVLRITR